MYLEVADIFWASVALLISTSLAVYATFKQWQMEQSRNEWRKSYYELKEWVSKP